MLMKMLQASRSVFKIVIKICILGLEEVRNGLIDKAQPHLARMAKAREKQAKKTNKGAMLMRLMGWTGGGLGVEGNGIDKPVDVNYCQTYILLTVFSIMLLATDMKLTDLELTTMVAAKVIFDLF